MKTIFSRGCELRILHIYLRATSPPLPARVPARDLRAHPYVPVACGGAAAGPGEHQVVAVLARIQVHSNVQTARVIGTLSHELEHWVHK